jgi:hypothetical protein
MGHRDYYYDVNKYGKIFITSENPNKITTKKIKDWFIDKWQWLLTFNKMPSITIDCDRIVFREGQESPVIRVNGRMLLQLNGDIVNHKKEKDNEQ